MAFWLLAFGFCFSLWFSFRGIICKMMNEESDRRSSSPQRRVSSHHKKHNDKNANNDNENNNNINNVLCAPGGHQRRTKEKSKWSAISKHGNVSKATTPTPHPSPRSQKNQIFIYDILCDMQRFRISSQINYYFWFRWGSLSRLSGQVRF